ncbi:MAG TPA: DUF883 family protein [Steroidobacteraceae bacterium]|nr:DUF883 family protein [Steroidobacteraceae bacterium]
MNHTASAADGASDQLKASARRTGRAASGEMKNLLADVEDLIARIGDVKDAEVARLRTKLRDSIDSAKDGMAGSAETLKRRAREAAGTADDYVRGSPWQAIGVAALVGIALGYVASRRS